MSDPTLQWLKELIIERDANNGQFSLPKRANLSSVQRKLFKHLSNFKIIKNLIYFIDKNKFGNELRRYVVQKNEIKLTIQEMQDTKGPIKRSKRSNRGFSESALTET